MLQLLIVFAAACASKEVWGLKCVSERGANLTILLQDQDQWEVDAKTCYVRARYDIESDRVFMVEMYGMDDEPEKLGIRVDNGTYFGTMEVNFACKKRDRCNNIKSFSDFLGTGNIVRLRESLCDEEDALSTFSTEHPFHCQTIGIEKFELFKESREMYIHRAKVPADAKRINAITRGFMHQYKIGRIRERRLRYGVLYGIWAIVLVLCAALFLQIGSGVTSYAIRSRPPRKKKVKQVRT